MWCVLLFAVKEKFSNGNVKFLVLTLHRIYFIFMLLLEIKCIIGNVYIAQSYIILNTQS